MKNAIQICSLSVSSNAGIRVQSLKKGQITMDIDFRWGGDPSIILAVEALVASLPIQVNRFIFFTSYLPQHWWKILTQWSLIYHAALTIVFSSWDRLSYNSHSLSNCSWRISRFSLLYVSFFNSLKRYHAFLPLWLLSFLRYNLRFWFLLIYTYFERKHCPIGIYLHRNLTW